VALSLQWWRRRLYFQTKLIIFSKLDNGLLEYTDSQLRKLLV